MNARVYAPSLQDWFFMYMMRKWWCENFYVTGTLKVEVTALAEAYRSKRKLPPYTAILLKAIGMAARKHPAINRITLRTFYGDRVVQFEDVKVCLPILYKVDGETHMRVETLMNPQEMSIAGIRQAIRGMRTKELAKNDIARFYLSRPNSFLGRLYLKFAYFLLANFPRYSVSKGLCGVGISSNIGLNEKDFVYQPVAISPTAIHVTLGTVETLPDGREFLPLGLCYNHLACRGDEAQVAVQTLWKLLSGRSEEGLEPFLA